MMTAEHRKPLVAFFLVFAAACLIMGNGMRSQVVEVLIGAGAPRELIAAVSPDIVLGQSLTSAPTPQAVREVPASVNGPVQADEDDVEASGSPSPIQSAIESAVASPDSVVVSSRARAAAQNAAADRRARAANDRARADRGPARATPAARSAARPAARPAVRPAANPALNPKPDPGAAKPLPKPEPKPAPRPDPKPAPAKGPGKAAPATDHGGKPGPRRVASRHDHDDDRDHAMNRQTRGPERRATGRGASRQAAPARSNRDQGRDRSSHDSRRHDSRHEADRGSQRGPGGGGHHNRGGHGGGPGGGHGPSGHRH